MKLLIFGATGPTGRHLVSQGLALGHEVTAFCRNPGDLVETNPKFRAVKGDIADPATIDAAMPGHDAVMSALGVFRFRHNTIYSEGTRRIIESAARHGVRRLVWMTALGVGDSKDQPPWVFRWIIAPLLLRSVYPEKERAEQAIMASGLDWTIARPPGLTNGPKTGVYQVWVGPRPKKITARISRADVADFMLATLAEKQYVRKAVGMSY
jgi:uncharacterized protein YbjT (DUF2867 family)